MKRIWLLVPALVTVSGSAAGFDSKCRADDGAECEPGPVTARRRWNAHDSEHAQLWDRITGPMDLPDHLRATVRLEVPTIAARVEGVETVQPHPFAETTNIARREYKIAEMTQLPDLAYSLWDWAMGNEVCPIGPLQTVRACHSFSSHMGTLNSSHFLPQAENWYRYYHELAVERATVCGNMRARLDLSFPEYLEQCDQQAFTFEAIAHHYLQDAWSMGHMWQRWGGPEPLDFGDDDWRERGLLAALSAGLIHGAKGVLQEAIDTNEWVRKIGLSGGRVDFRDAMCAPIDPRDFPCDSSEFVCVAPDVPLEPPAYIDGADGSKHAGIGDLFASDLSTSFTYRHAWQRLVGCAESSIQDVADAAGLAVVSGNTVPPPLSEEYSDLCFAQRATNASMWLGAGVDAVLEDVQVLPEIGFDAPIFGHITLMAAKHFTFYIHAPLNPLIAAHTIPLKALGDREGSAAEVIIGLSESAGMTSIPEDMRAQFRLDLAGVADFIEDRARSNPDGIDTATGLPAVLGVNHNGASEYQHDPPAHYNDPPTPYEPSFSLETQFATDEDRADALARAFHKGFATEWCTVTTAEDLETLKTTEPGPLCEVCGEFAGRHLRFGTEDAFDGAAISLCDSLEIPDTVIYLDIDNYEELSFQEAGEIWCGCREAPEDDVPDDDDTASGTECEGQFAGRVVDFETRQPVEGAVVSYGGETTSGSDGTFESELLPCGEYGVEIVAEGYVTAQLGVAINEDGVVVQLVELKALDEACALEAASLGGHVIDGFTGEPVVDATIEIREGPGASSSDPLLDNVVSDTDGLYLVEGLTGGYYTIEVSADGYEASGLREVSACGDSDLRDVHLIPRGAPGFSFVLNWARPDDMDLHLLLPSGDEVAFGECAGSAEEEPFALFEVDHLAADGPESIRIVDVLPGVYTLYVHNFSAQNDGADGFEGSEAEVVVYEDSAPIMSFAVPTSGSGFFWDVLEFEGTIDSLEIRTLGRLTNNRANPFAEDEYSAACTPVGP